ncbi:hypothetical protein SKAU_G00410030 [Synaphobranchus kaupii]|uniref:THAP-type domain-containing protein n=1 Tax=Synaphobranchus kaupii TaxID=118154 RepID=A0A9Q1E7I8_SYNKA|nr:hypothetical protein SKAU_G00410030 [Synaphobranchus kaupii]
MGTTVTSFHPFPVEYQQRKQLWLLAARMDVNTPIETLKKFKVCSDHFTEDDYVKIKKGRSGYPLLKETAVPSPAFLHAPKTTDEQQNGLCRQLWSTADSLQADTLANLQLAPPPYFHREYRKKKKRASLNPG